MRFAFKLFQSVWNLTATTEQRCRDACQISERCDHSNMQSRGFETSRNLAVRRSSTLWIEAQNLAIGKIEKNANFAIYIYIYPYIAKFVLMLFITIIIRLWRPTLARHQATVWEITSKKGLWDSIKRNDPYFKPRSEYRQISMSQIRIGYMYFLFEFKLYLILIMYRFKSN